MHAPIVSCVLAGRRKILPDLDFDSKTAMVQSTECLCPARYPCPSKVEVAVPVTHKRVVQVERRIVHGVSEQGGVRYLVSQAGQLIDAIGGVSTWQAWAVSVPGIWGALFTNKKSRVVHKHSEQGLHFTFSFCILQRIQALRCRVSLIPLRTLESSMGPLTAGLFFATAEPAVRPAARGAMVDCCRTPVGFPTGVIGANAGVKGVQELLASPVSQRNTGITTSKAPSRFGATVVPISGSQSDGRPASRRMRSQDASQLYRKWSRRPSALSSTSPIPGMAS